jgi:hypothetical protein
MRFQNDEHLTGVHHCDVQKLLADAIDADHDVLQNHVQLCMGQLWDQEHN